MTSELVASKVSGIRQIPSLSSNLVFRLKASLLQTRRAFLNVIDGEIRQHPFGNELKNAPVLAESVSRLWTTGTSSEFLLTAGKIQNLRVAARRFNGIEVPPGGVFSFWAQLGKTTRRKGFAEGRELREGCLIPTVGGGLCQLSNALYDAALTAGFDIIERHPHSRVVPGSLAEFGRDATVFWNYVDLRFRPANGFRLEVTLDSENLIVTLRGKKTETPLQTDGSRLLTLSGVKAKGPNGCETCGVTGCFRSGKPPESRGHGQSAILVERLTPELEAYLGAQNQPGKVAFSPDRLRNIQKPVYLWTIGHRLSLLQGTSRAKIEIEHHRTLARRFSRKLTPDITELTVEQGVLPFLWANGDLGGRVFDVLMTAPPMSVIHERLDLALSRHPESKTLGDFRAEPELVEFETEALGRARRILTANADIAKLLPEKALLLPWKTPSPKMAGKNRARGMKIVFPASTLGRKGVFELREAIRGLDVTLILMGNELEGPGFWDGFNVERRAFSEMWLEEAAAVVLPAYIENNPYRLIEAAAGGVPVIASTSCGLHGFDSVTHVEPGDVTGLRASIEKIL